MVLHQFSFDLLVTAKANYQLKNKQDPEVSSDKTHEEGNKV